MPQVVTLLWLPEHIVHCFQHLCLLLYGANSFKSTTTLKLSALKQNCNYWQITDITAYFFILFIYLLNCKALAPCCNTIFLFQNNKDLLDFYFLSWSGSGWVCADCFDISRATPCLITAGGGFSILNYPGASCCHQNLNPGAGELDIYPRSLGEKCVLSWCTRLA